MPTPSKRFRSWDTVVFHTVPLTGVIGIDPDDGIQDIQEGSDMDLGPTHSVVSFLNPSFGVRLYDASALASITPGSPGIFTATWADSKNGSGVGSGALVFTTNGLSYIGARTRTGAYNQLGTEQVTIKTSWADGITNPVSISSR